MGGGGREGINGDRMREGKGEGEKICMGESKGPEGWEERKSR